MTNPKIYQTTELGIEKQCPHCEDWWPHDTEFYHKQSNHLAYWCKACVLERKKKYYLKLKTIAVGY